MRASLPHSIRGRLIALTLALLLPAVIVTSILLWRAYVQEHDAAESRLSDTARALSLVVDRQIGQSSVLLEALATSNRLKRGDFAAFDAQVREANTDPTRWVAVVGPDGQLLLNTLAPFGTALPRAHNGDQGPAFALQDGPPHGGGGLHLIGFPMKGPKLRLLTAMTDEVDDTACQHDCRRDQHTGAQQLPDHSLQVLVLYFPFSGGHVHML